MPTVPHYQWTTAYNNPKVVVETLDIGIAVTKTKFDHTIAVDTLDVGVQVVGVGNVNRSVPVDTLDVGVEAVGITPLGGEAIVSVETLDIGISAPINRATTIQGTKYEGGHCWQITVGGTDFTDYIDPKSITLTDAEGSEIPSFSLEVRDKNNAFDIRTWQEVQWIMDPGVAAEQVIFGGYVVKPAQRDDESGVGRIFQIKAEGYVARLHKERAVERTWVDTAPETIIYDLFDDVGLAGEYDVVSQVAAAADRPSFSANRNEKIPAVLDRLALEYGWVWRIDGEKTLHFTPPSTTPAPFRVSDGANVNWADVFPARGGSFQKGDNVSEIKNKIVVTGGQTPSDTITETAVGNGTKYRFILAHRDIIDIEVRVDGIVVPDGTAWWHTPGERACVTNYAEGWVEFVTFIPAIGASIEFAYQYWVPVSYSQTHPASIAYYGQTFTHYVDDNTITTLNQAKRVAQGLLDEYAYGSIDGEFTIEKFGLRAGQQIHLRFDNHGINGWYTLRKVTFRIRNRTQIEATVKFGGKHARLSSVLGRGGTYESATGVSGSGGSGLSGFGDQPSAATKWYAQRGSGGGWRYATFVIAAADSDLASRDAVDYSCDGLADDVEINAALSAGTTSGYRKIILLEGTYNLSAPLVIAEDKTWLCGSGPGTILLRDDANWTGGNYGLTADTVDDTKLTDFTYDGDVWANYPGTKRYDGFASFLDCDTITIRDVTILQCRRTGIVDMQSVRNVRIEDVHAKNCLGFLFNGYHDTDPEAGYRFDYMENIVIRGCSVSEAQYDRTLLDVSFYTYALVSLCSFYGEWIWSDALGTDIIPDPQEMAIQNVTVTECVATNSHNENSYFSRSNNAEIGIFAACNNITISNNQCYGGDWSLNLTDCGGASITGNNISYVYDAAILIDADDYANTGYRGGNHLTISGNSFIDVSGNGVALVGADDAVGYDDWCQVPELWRVRATVTGNYFEACSEAITCQLAAFYNITGNQMVNCDSHGVEIVDAWRANVTGNHFHLCETAVGVYGNFDAVAGVNWGGQIAITGNQFIHNQWAGVYLSGAVNCHIGSNHFENNGFEGYGQIVLALSWDDSFPAHNHFVGNTLRARCPYNGAITDYGIHIMDPECTFNAFSSNDARWSGAVADTLDLGTNTQYLNHLTRVGVWNTNFLWYKATDVDTMGVGIDAVNITVAGPSGWVNKTITANAIIYGTDLNSFTANAVLINPYFGGTVTAEAFITYTNHYWFNANAVISRDTVSGSVSADAYLVYTSSDSVTADAYIQVPEGGSVTADAWIEGTYGSTVTIDSRIVYAQSGSITADAYLRAYETGSITADAWFTGHLSGSVTGDAILKAPVSGSMTADARIIQQRVEQSVTADAYISETVQQSVAAGATVALAPHGAFVQRAASQTLTGTPAAISFDTETRDDDGFYSAGQPTRLSAVEAGWHLIAWTIERTGGSTYGILGWLRPNGSGQLAGDRHTNIATTTGIHGMSLLYMTAGQYVELMGESESSSQAVTATMSIVKLNVGEAAQIQRTTDTTINTTSTFVFTSEIRDDGGLADLATNPRRLTAVSTGWHLITACTFVSTTADARQLDLKVVKNTSTVIAASSIAHSDIAEPKARLAIAAYLTAGDYIELQGTVDDTLTVSQATMSMARLANTVGAEIQRYSNQTNTAGSETPIEWGGETRDDLDFWTNTDYAVVTARMPGWYVIAGHAYFDYGFLYLRSDGSLLAATHNNYSTSLTDDMYYGFMALRYFDGENEITVGVAGADPLHRATFSILAA